MAGYRRLGMDDRVQIQVLTKRGISDAEIARELRVHRSTVGRERQRNKVDGKYYYHQAQACAEKRQRERKRRPSKLTAAMVAFIEEKLRLGWSPQQIGRWLKHRQAELASVSYERIYWHVWRNKIDGGNLYRHLRRDGRRYRIDTLRFAYSRLKRQAAAGVDGETWRHYGEALEDNLQSLSHRLKRGAYRAKPVRRVYIPKADGRQRPLGVTALEDKFVQRARWRY